LHSMSSANSRVSPGLASIGKSSIMIENWNGLSGEPCETPILRSRFSEVVCPSLSL
jgi:hypothetical protein